VKCSKPIIGLAGGIGSGKSSVARILESLGAAVIDADRLAHEQLDDPEVIATLRTWWGDSILTPEGRIDRKAVAGRVFSDPAELARLEALLYPRIERRREELTAGYVSDIDVPAVVLDAPKLYEAGLDELCDVVIFVDSADATRAQRVASSRGWSKSEWASREKLFEPLDRKRAGADYIVANNSSIDDLRSEIERVFSAVLASFS
jgi:dephospho-CoA kinase